MNLFRNVVFIAAIAGLVAGVVLACMPAFATVPLILKAEVYEQAGGGHHHDHAAPTATDTNAMSTAAPAGNAMSSAAPAPAEAAAPAAEDEGWAPADGFERFAFSVVAYIVTGIGFALILVAVSEFAGGIGNWRQGVFGSGRVCRVPLAPASACSELPKCPRPNPARSGGRQRRWQPRRSRLIAFRRSLPLAILAVADRHSVSSVPQPAIETPIPEGLISS